MSTDPAMHAAPHPEDRGFRISGGAIAFLGLALTLLATVAAGASKAGALDEKVRTQAAAQVDAGKHVEDHEARIRELERNEAATAEHLRNVDETLKQINSKLDDALAGRKH